MAVYECARCNALAYSASRGIAFACARAVRWHLEDRVLVYEGRTVVF